MTYMGYEYRLTPRDRGRWQWEVVRGPGGSWLSGISGVAASRDHAAQAAREAIMLRVDSPDDDEDDDGGF